MGWPKAPVSALVAAAALGIGLTGCGGTTPSSTWTPTIQVHQQSVPAMPSFYNGMTRTKIFTVGLNRPWTITKKTLSGQVLRRFWIPSKSRPKIVYVMPQALAVMVAKPAPVELLLSTSSGHLAHLWRLPHAVSLYGASRGGFGGHTFFWEATAGVQGPVATYGAYNLRQDKRVALQLAQLEGSWYDDMGRGAMYRLKGTQLTLWQHGRWVSQGQLPSGAVEAISQQSWIMTAVPKKGGDLELHWFNVRSGLGTTQNVKGTMEASGSDWALLLRGSTLVLAIPSQHTVRVVARSVQTPLTANDAVYWTNAQGQVQRVMVAANAVSAVPNIIWP